MQLSMLGNCPEIDPRFEHGPKDFWALGSSRGRFGEPSDIVAQLFKLLAKTRKLIRDWSLVVIQVAIGTATSNYSSTLIVFIAAPHLQQAVVTIVRSSL